MLLGMYYRYFSEERRHPGEETLRAPAAHPLNVVPGRYPSRGLCVWLSISLLAGALPGCALNNAFKKCGFHGCPGDAEITADVVLQFTHSSFLEPNVITVQTLDHVVYLHGAVVSGLEIATAEEIASQVPGVKRVINSIVALNVR